MRAIGERLASVPTDADDAQIWRALDAWNQAGPAAMHAIRLLNGSVHDEAPVRAVCQRVGFSYERLVTPQLAVGERTARDQQALDLAALAATASRTL